VLAQAMRAGGRIFWRPSVNRVAAVVMVPRTHNRNSWPEILRSTNCLATVTLPSAVVSRCRRVRGTTALSTAHSSRRQRGWSPVSRAKASLSSRTYIVWSPYDCTAQWLLLRLNEKLNNNKYTDRVFASKTTFYTNPYRYRSISATSTSEDDLFYTFTIKFNVWYPHG